MPSLPTDNPDRAQRLKHAAEAVSRTIASSLSPDDLLLRVVGILSEELQYPFAGIFRVEPAGQWAVLAAAAHKSAAHPALPADFKLSLGGNSLVGIAARLRLARLVPDIDREAGFLRNLHLHLPESRAEIALPMLDSEQIVGVLSLQSSQSDGFSPAEQETLQAIATELAAAMHHAALHHQNLALLQRSERRARLFEAASQVAHKVTSIRSLDELLPKTVEIICSAYGFYYAGVFLIDDSGEWAVLRAGYGEAGRILMHQHHRLAVGGASMIGMTTALGEARIALDVGEERVHFKNPVLPFTRSEMSLPLRIGHGAARRILGAVTVQSVEENAFTDEDILTLQTMADQLAIAINNANLLRELEQAHSELLRTKTYAALTAATTAAIHWIGNKALPITTTIARLQADLAGGSFDPDSVQEDLEMIAQNAGLIVAVKENLLGPAREQMPRPALLSDVAQAAAALAGVPAAALTIAAVQAEPLALADTASLARALVNLYRNALEAGAHHLLVQITAAPADSVLLRLTDDGEGIPPDVIEHMWAPFVTSKGSGHSGLGLTAVLHIVTQLQGNIRAASTPGQGASFEITLPAAPPPPLGEGGAGEANSGVRGTSVLLIDDDDAWARFAVQTLHAAGLTCQHVQALAGVDLSAPGLILLDEALQAASLPDTLAALQAAGAASKTLLLTPVPAAERAAAQLKTGIRDVALKPYTAEGLLGMV